MRSLVTFALLTYGISYAASIVGAEKLCCVCSTLGGISTVRESPNLNSCRDACEANEKPVDDYGWNIDRSQSCFRAGLPPPLTPGNLVDEIVYLVGHQGAGVWKDGPGDELISGRELKVSLTGVDGIKRLVKISSPSDVETATKGAVKKCVSQTPDIEKHFAYVCSDMRQHDNMTSTLRNNQYNAARDLFSLQQRDADAIKNRLRCYSNSEIAVLIKNHCPPAAPPPVDQNINQGTGQKKVTGKPDRP